MSLQGVHDNGPQVLSPQPKWGQIDEASQHGIGTQSGPELKENFTNIDQSANGNVGKAVQNHCS